MDSRNVRDKPIDNTQHADRPPQRVITPDTPPIEDQVRREVLPQYQGNKQAENEERGVVPQLQDQDGAEYLEWREFAEGARAGRFSPGTGHFMESVGGLISVIEAIGSL
jgi:hypothetical protein